MSAPQYETSCSSLRFTGRPGQHLRSGLGAECTVSSSTVGGHRERPGCTRGLELSMKDTLICALPQPEKPAENASPSAARLAREPRSALNFPSPAPTLLTAAASGRDSAGTA